MEPFLQLSDLEAGEGGARLLALGRRPVLVGVADPPRHRERGCNRHTTNVSYLVVLSSIILIVRASASVAL